MLAYYRTFEEGYLTELLRSLATIGTKPTPTPTQSTIADYWVSHRLAHNLDTAVCLKYTSVVSNMR